MSAARLKSGKRLGSIQLGRLLGFSLIEVLVGLAIGLVVVIVIGQTLSVSEGFRRTTTGGSDTQSSAAVALHFIERDFRMAGYGLLTVDTTGIDRSLFNVCSAIAVKRETASAPSSIATTDYLPASINVAGAATSTAFGSDAGSDVLQVAYANPYGGNTNWIRTQPKESLTSNRIELTTDPSTGVAPIGAIFPGDRAVLVRRVGTPSPDLPPPIVAGVAPAAPCVMVEVTEVVRGECSSAAVVGGHFADIQNFVYFEQKTPATAGYISYRPNNPTPCDLTSPVASQWNTANFANFNIIDPITTVNGLPDYTIAAPANASGGWLYNLGPDGVTSRLYKVLNQTLQQCDPTAIGGCAAASANWTTLVENVVAMRVLYGLDNNNDKAVDVWTTAPPALNNWRSFLAARVVVVARSPVQEKQLITRPVGLTPGLVNTVGQVGWQGAAISPIDLSGLPNWDQYRYTVSETTIPIRNGIWQ